MNSKLMAGGSLSLVGVLAVGGVAAHADSINISGVLCRNYNASQALDIDYFSNRVRNINASPRPVVCSVPRSPLSVNITPSFYVDGHNNANACTSCTLTMYHFTGGIAATESFTNCGSATAPVDWDQFVTFPTLPGPDTFDYASLFCTLPGEGNGSIYGVTAIQL